MKDRIRETSERWKDVPGKVVGAGDGPAALPTQLHDAAVYRKGWPKGVFRFRSFEESDQWPVDNVRLYRC